MSFSAGAIFLIGSGASHTAMQDRQDPPSIVSLRFGLYDLVQAQLGEQRLLRNSAQALEIPLEDQVVRAALFEQLVQAHHQRRPQEAAALLQVLLCRFIPAADRIAGITSTVLDERIERVRQQLDLHPVRRWTIADMTDLAGLSRNYFVRLFTEQVGMAPKQYQIRARLRFARYLLEHTDASVQQVASDLLYPDAYVFSKQYRKFHGISPSQARLG